MAKARVTPMKIVNDLWGARTALALAAAVDLDVFTAIAQGKKTAADVAKSLNVSQRGIERLLDSLTGIGYLTKRNSRYGLTPTADTFLVRTKHTYVGAMAKESQMTLPM